MHMFLALTCLFNFPPSLEWWLGKRWKLHVYIGHIGLERKRNSVQSEKELAKWESGSPHWHYQTIKMVSSLVHLFWDSSEVLIGVKVNSYEPWFLKLWSFQLIPTVPKHKVLLWQTIMIQSFYHFPGLNS